MPASWWRVWPLIAMVFLALTGCDTPAIDRAEFATVPADQVARLMANAKPQDALVSVDDLLEITYLKRYPNDQSQYHFDVGDAIELQFFTHFDAPQTYVVQPDGRIYLPEIGSLMVRGLTADEIAVEVAKGYKTTRMAGPVNVVARGTDAKVNELLGALGRGTNGSIKTSRVLPDGTISLPMIDVVTVAGETIGEVESMLNERYGLLYADLHVSVALQETNARRFGVLGQVKTPGVYPLTAQTTVLEALAKAGGVLDAAKHGTTDTYDVVLLRKKPDGGIETEQLTIGSNEAVSQLAAITVMPSDIMYVPTSHIEELDRFVGQYITRILPFGLSVGYGYSTPLTY